MAYNTKKVIMVGKTGNGKSSLGNNLLGIMRFRVGGGFNAVTTACQLERNRKMEIVDTPGLFDTNRNMNVAEQALEIIETLKLCPKPHAFLIVVKFERFTAEEISVLDVLRITFGEQCLKHTIVVVTHVENAVSEDEFLNECKKSREVSALVKGCGKRIVRIDNKEPNSEHIDNIIRYINRVSEDGNSFFKNDYQWCHKEVLKRHSDLNNHDSTLIHEQVKTISNDLQNKVSLEIRNAEEARRQREQRENEEKEQRERKEREQKDRDDMIIQVGSALLIGLVTSLMKR